MTITKKLFKKKNPTIIGMVHCSPLMGHKSSPGEKKVEKKFLSDLDALIQGGVDSIMIENNYDIPHFEKACRSTIPQLANLCIKARKKTNKPIGLCVLWNDYETALSIAKIAKLDFIRMPVFVDKVDTSHGIFNKKAKEAIKYRKLIDAENVLIFADVQVKHAKHLIQRKLSTAIKDTVKNKADGIIITGKWTGDPPTQKDVDEAKKITKSIPLILGSGITPENVKNYNVDGIIIGTYFKGDLNPKEGDFHNIFPWKVKIKRSRVKKFMESLK